ncbi:hypothetical protein OGAPHI_000024 [Ogataea philodendri]|uniref:type II protein arginine methyltransferase n=1 Tax=Ogataea philodendri TaxID=1378263 RepID=A0A9P8T9Y4_9ASCO|nr:uncharacterized protein OGAPHI_000024 [Ogataea philodendri]KAH3671838.1 hypothetical protein OGAPHI_000024 [Ogataea philodendri]
MWNTKSFINGNAVVVNDNVVKASGSKKTAKDLLASKKKTHEKLYDNLSDEDREKMRLINQPSKDDPMGLKLALGVNFYKSVFEVLEKGKPKVAPLTNYKSTDRIYHAGYEVIGEGPALSKEYLSGFLQLSKSEIDSMKKSHGYVVRNLPDTYPAGFYSGNGVVYVGGGKFNWLALLSIKTLRSVGSKLPVEVLIPKLDEYEIDLCSTIFPALDARCIYMPKQLGDEISSRFSFFGYQYKALALMLSSFENVLLLDADNTPLHAPDNLFETEPFISTGMVIWPDYWKRSTSPAFYDIVNIEIDESHRLSKGFQEYGRHVIPNSPPHQAPPLHQLRGAIPDPSSESGQLMISKKTHTRVMLLSLYYNMYGPNHYYPLLSQGSDGEGDKETFIAAAHVLKKPFYQVKKIIKSIGRWVDFQFTGSAMGQFNSHDDYELYKKYEDSDEQVYDIPNLLFLHSNFPKLDPWSLKEDEVTYNPATGKRDRLYGTGYLDALGFDFELVQWENMKFFICDLKLHPKLFADRDIDHEELCTEIKEHLVKLDIRLAHRLVEIVEPEFYWDLGGQALELLRWLVRLALSLFLVHLDKALVSTHAQRVDGIAMWPDVRSVVDIELGLEIAVVSVELVGSVRDQVLVLLGQNLQVRPIPVQQHRLAVHLWWHPVLNRKIGGVRDICENVAGDSQVKLDHRLGVKLLCREHFSGQTCLPSMNVRLLLGLRLVQFQELLVEFVLASQEKHLVSVGVPFGLVLRQRGVFLTHSFQQPVLVDERQQTNSLPGHLGSVHVDLEIGRSELNAADAGRFFSETSIGSSVSVSLTTLTALALPLVSVLLNRACFKISATFLFAALALEMVLIFWTISLLLIFNPPAVWPVVRFVNVMFWEGIIGAFSLPFPWDIQLHFEVLTQNTHMKPQERFLLVGSLEPFLGILTHVHLVGDSKLSLGLVFRKNIFTKHTEMRLVSSETQENQIGVQSVNTMGGVWVVFRVRSLRSDEIHDLVLAFSRNSGIADYNLQASPSRIRGQFVGHPVAQRPCKNIHERSARNHAHAKLNAVQSVFQNKNHEGFDWSSTLQTFNKYPLVTFKRLQRRPVPPIHVKMLSSDFIEDSLYNQNYGYFPNTLKRTDLFSPDYFTTKSPKPGELQLTQPPLDLDNFPSQLLKPSYGQAIARYLLVNYKLNQYPYNDLCIYEIGSGSNNLMSSILDFIQETHPEVYERTRYNLVPVSPKLTDKTITIDPKHHDKIRIVNESILGWKRRVNEPCFVMALEVFNSLAHDVVRYDIESHQPYQGYVMIDENNEFKEVYSPTLSDWTQHFLHLREQSKFSISTLKKHPLNQSKILKQLKDTFNPLRNHLSDAEYVPTRLLRLFEVLKNYFPNHQLISSDFSKFKKPVAGYNSPTVQTMYRDELFNTDTYMVKQGYFNIMFPLQFDVMAEIYRLVVGKLCNTTSQIEFLNVWGDSEGAPKATPDTYLNCEFLLS